MFLHIFLCVTGSMTIGYIVHLLIHWRYNHDIVKFGHGVLSDIDLLIILAIVGLIVSFF